MKSVVEFLWGSPITTDKSDEDWLIFVDKKSELPLRPALQLAGERDRYIDGTRREISQLPKLLYDKPIYTLSALFCAKCYADWTARNQIEWLFEQREDIARMNLPNFRSSISQYIQTQENRNLFCRPLPKYKSKLAQNYCLAIGMSEGKSYEEAWAKALQVARQIKLKELSEEDSSKVLDELKEKFYDEQTQKFFLQEPNDILYEKVKQTVGSIDLENLSTLPVYYEFNYLPELE